MKLLAQNTIDLYDTSQGNLKGFGILGLEGNQNATGVFTTFLSSTIGLITVIAIIWFIITMLTGAIGIISSGGDKNSNESAKKKITAGLIGLVVTISALFILNLVGTIFGIPNILQIGNLIDSLNIR